MSQIYKDFETYSLSIISSKYFKEKATITCYHTENNQIKAVGLLRFFKEGDIMRDNVYDGTTTIYLSFDMSYLSDITQLLRFEKPLRLTFDPQTKTGNIETKFSEPTGEQE